MKRILIVEDDQQLCQELAELLNNAGYETAFVEDFSRTQETMEECAADLILLDINIPGQNGEMLLKNLRKISEVPVIMLTSRNTEVDEVLSMSYGADDYITKPYNPTILLLRVAAILKRAGQTGDALEWRDVRVYTSRGSLVQGERELALTKNEMLIFELLLQGRGKIVSRDALMTYLWDNDEYINDNALTVNVSRLRSKLADFGYEDAIVTKKKQGYLLN